jgi:hypothetical protein
VGTELTAREDLAKKKTKQAKFDLLQDPLQVATSVSVFGEISQPDWRPKKKTRRKKT